MSFSFFNVNNNILLTCQFENVNTIFCFSLEAQEKLKKYREDNERKSREVLELWDSSVKHKIKQLGNDREYY